MTSHAPRLPDSNQPSWTSVDIHWTDSDTTNFSRVDGLPWIRLTDKAKLFNKNKSVRVVAKYRSTDNLDPSRQYKHVSMIADAIEQYVLVEIALPKPVSASPGPDWPKFRVWAFLQPPTIGNKPDRIARDGGYVLDDTPRAGWFEATVDGPSLQCTIMDHTSGHQKPPTPVAGKVWASQDPDDAKILRFKLLVRVANSESMEELAEKTKELRRKGLDASLMEAGSYLKVWVRNEDRRWKKDPKDDDSEALVQSMAEADLIRVTGRKGPHCYRNHEWKRSRMAAHKSIFNGKSSGDHDAFLLYVGLYPAHVIEKLEKVEAALKAPPPHTINKYVWLGTAVLYASFLWSLRQARNEWGKKMASGKPATVGENPHVVATKRIVNLLKKLQVPELFTGYAVGGIETFTKIPDTVKRATEQHPDAQKQTLRFFKSLIKHILEMDDPNKFSQALDQELAKWNKEMDPEASKGWRKFKPKDVYDWGVDLQGESFKASLGLLEGKTSKRFPPHAQPIPVPWLAWLAWHAGVELSGSLKVEFNIDVKDIEKGALKISVLPTGKGGVSLEAGIRAIWTEVANEAIDAANKKSSDPLFDIFKDLLKYVDIELLWKFATDLTAQAGAVLQIQQTKDSITLDTSLVTKFQMPLHAQLSILEFNYDTFNGTICNLTPEGGVLLDDVKVFGSEMTGWRKSFPWGKNDFTEFCYLRAKKENVKSVTILGREDDVRLPFTESSSLAAKCTGGISYTTPALAAQGGVGVILVDGLPCAVEDAPSGEKGGEVVWKTAFTWAPTPSKLRPGQVRFWDLRQSKRKDLLEFFHALKSLKSLKLKPQVTPPSASGTKPSARRLSDDSSLEILWPNAQDLVAMARLQGSGPPLTFSFQVDYYMDRYIWVQVFSPDSHSDASLWESVSSMVSGPPEIKGPWKLVRLLGAGELHSQRTIGLTQEDAGIPLASGKSYGLRLALLDEDSCVFHTTTQLAKS